MSIRPVTEKFIGRERESETFIQWLAKFGIADTPWILYFHDALEEDTKKGGVGKTKLLQRCLELIEQQYTNIIPVTIDFFSVADRDGIVIAERVVQALQKRYTDWPAASFKNFLDEYRQPARERRADSADIRERLGQVLTADLELLHESMCETNTYLLLFFDTFELIERNPVIAVLRLAQMFPDNYHFDRIRVVMAGRNAIQWSHQNWAGREKEVRSIPLSPFSREETVQYLLSRCDICDWENLPPSIVDALYDRTEGRPILIGLVGDILNSRKTSLDNLISISKPTFKASLVEQIHDFDHPISWAILFMAHIYHRFDATLLDLIMNTPGLREWVPEITYQQLQSTLPYLSFVRHSSSSNGDFVLHDEMRHLVNVHCWEKQDPDKRMRRDLSNIAIQYYTERIQQERSEERRQSYIVEQAFHMFFVDINEGFKFSKRHFAGAIRLTTRAFARSLFQMAHEFEHGMSPEQQRMMGMAEARLLRAEENSQAALYLYEALEKADSIWAGQHSSELLYGKGRCYQFLSRFPEAIDCFKACLEIEEASENRSRQAKILGLLGYIHRRRGELKEAMEYYERSLDVQRGLDNPQVYATMLNNIANVYRLQGKVEEALRFCKLGLAIRSDLFRQGKASELYVGLSLSTMGLIYNTRDEAVAAERCFRDAFEVYQRVGDKSGLAATYSSLGQILMAKGELDTAFEYFTQEHRISSGIDLEVHMDSLNKQGRVCALQGRWELATGYFEQAIALARRMGDSYHEAENLLDLAQTLHHLGQPPSQAVKEAKRISNEHAYNNLLGHAEEIQGDMLYNKHEYRAAFRHYAAACRYMALHNPLQFQKFLRRLVDLLIGTPSSFLPGTIDSLLDYWVEQGLDKSYPDLLTACKEVSRHMLL